VFFRSVIQELQLIDSLFLKTSVHTKWQGPLHSTHGPLCGCSFIRAVVDSYVYRSTLSLNARNSSDSESIVMGMTCQESLLPSQLYFVVNLLLQWSLMPPRTKLSVTSHHRTLRRHSPRSLSRYEQVLRVTPSCYHKRALSSRMPSILRSDMFHSPLHGMLPERSHSDSSATATPIPDYDCSRHRLLRRGERLQDHPGAQHCKMSQARLTLMLHGTPLPLGSAVLAHGVMVSP
jgi:hypothetical protein